MNARSGSILVGLTAVLLTTVACASTPPKTAAQINANHMLADRVQNALDSDPVYFFRHVDVDADADDGRVWLSGYVWTDDAIRRAEHIASHVSGVTSVADELTLEREGGRSSR
jgi:osmotically-inducible protein OsmY